MWERGFAMPLERRGEVFLWFSRNPRLDLATQFSVLYHGIPTKVTWCPWAPRTFLEFAIKTGYVLYSWKTFCCPWVFSAVHESHSTRLATSKNLFLLRVNSSSGKCSLKFIGPKVRSSIPDDIKFSTTFTFKWKLKKHLLHEKNSQLWTLATFHLSNKLLWILVLCNSNLFFVCIYFFVFSVCTFYAFRHEVHFLIFSVLLCFLLYLINKFL